MRETDLTLKNYAFIIGTREITKLRGGLVEGSSAIIQVLSDNSPPFSLIFNYNIFLIIVDKQNS